MNDRYLFRGKELCGGGWVYGDLRNFYDHEEIYDGRICAAIGKGMAIDDPLGYVFLDTVGQYTGLTDKNGVKIFEGDIVKRPDHHMLGDIQFSNGVFGIEWTGNKKTKSLVGVWGQKHNLRCMDDMDMTEFEVIGNIHDNPELLEDNA